MLVVRHAGSGPTDKAHVIATAAAATEQAHNRLSESQGELQPAFCQCGNSFRKEKARAPVATAVPSFLHHMKFGQCVSAWLNPLPHCGLPGPARPYNWPASVGTQLWAIKQGNEVADTLCLDSESQQSSRFTHPAGCLHTGVVPNHWTTAASVTMPHKKGCGRRRAP